MKISKKDLVGFENRIRDLYEQGKIKTPIHLSGGNEEELLDIFKKIKKEDWVFSTWRSHYHALLKSEDRDWLEKEILRGNSMHINSRKHKIFTSSIVGGILPIALGTALALKKKRSKEHVWCFVGDMASEMGMFEECTKYAGGYNLPITFVVEDNGLGVYTPTGKVWKQGKANVISYKYKRKYPHHGIGKFVSF